MVAVNPLLSSVLFALALSAVTVGACADDTPELSSATVSVESPGGFMAEISLNTPEEVESALKRAEQLFNDGQIPAGTKPAQFILHGPEVALFLRENYNSHKLLIDLAARLSAFEVVEIKVCETRLDLLGRGKNDIYPFVGTVPFGPSEQQRLLDEQGYQYF